MNVKQLAKKQSKEPVGTRKSHISAQKQTLKQKSEEAQNDMRGAIYFSNSLCANELMTGETKGGYVSFPGPVSVVISPLLFYKKSRVHQVTLKIVE